MVDARNLLVVFAVPALMLSSPASAGWKLIPAGQVANLDGISVSPPSEWNQASGRPGKRGRVWTRDGLALNALEFFAAVLPGQSLYKERDRKRNPMPKFSRSLLLPELAEFFERSFRASNYLTDFELLESSPQSFGGHGGLKVRYRYSLPNDELTRAGEARLAIIGGKLYVANFYAPRLHYFEAGLAEAQAIMDSARF